MQLSSPAHGFSPFPGAALGWLFKVVPQLHLAEQALSLELFLQRLQGLINVVIADDNLQSEPPYIVALVTATDPL